MIIKNPFEHFFPDNLTPEEIHRLFVKEYTEHNSLTAYKHTIVEGSRGSGKSMLLKYLEPECQIIDFNGWEQFLSKTKAFIGIYINCNTGDYRKREFEELLAGGRDTKIVSEKIIIHDFIMRIAEWVIRTISEQLKKEIKEDPQIIDKIIITLDKKGIYADKSIYPRTICGLRNVFSNERILLSTAVEDYFEYYAKPNNYLSYSGNYVDASFQEGSFLFVLLNSFHFLH